MFFLDHRELDLFEPAFDRHGRSTLDLQFGQLLEVVFISGVGLTALAGDGLVFGSHSRQLQRLALINDRALSVQVILAIIKQLAGQFADPLNVRLRGKIGSLATLAGVRKSS